MQPEEHPVSYAWRLRVVFGFYSGMLNVQYCCVAFKSALIAQTSAYMCETFDLHVDIP